MDDPNTVATGSQEDREEAISKRLDAIGWALFFIMMGCLWLVPKGNIPEATWLIGVGLIMLGINLARYLNGLKPIGFTLFLGILALGSGLFDLLGIDLPVFPILLILVGLNILRDKLRSSN